MFMLSGYLLASKLVGGTGPRGVGAYLRQRAARLLPSMVCLALAALALGDVWDTAAPRAALRLAALFAGVLNYVPAADYGCVRRRAALTGSEPRRYVCGGGPLTLPRRPRALAPQVAVAVAVLVLLRRRARGRRHG